MSVRIFLSGRALEDIRAIESYSVDRWGDKTAEQYVGRIEAALNRIAETPDLLREEPEFAESLRFYRVEKHVLVCDVHGRDIYVLTILHTGMDIPSRLAKLQPQLSLEVRLFHDKLAAAKKRNR